MEGDSVSLSVISSGGSSFEIEGEIWIEREGADAAPGPDEAEEAEEEATDAEGEDADWQSEDPLRCARMRVLSTALRPTGRPPCMQVLSTARHVPCQSRGRAHTALHASAQHGAPPVLPPSPPLQTPPFSPPFSPPFAPSLEREPTPINSTSELPGIYGTSVDSFEDGINSTVDLPDGISFASVAPALIIRSEDAARVSSGVSFAITAPDEISSKEISPKASRKPHRVSAAASEPPKLGKSKPKRQVSSNMVVGIILQVRSPLIVSDCLPHHPAGAPPLNPCLPDGL